MGHIVGGRRSDGMADVATEQARGSPAARGWRIAGWCAVALACVAAGIQAVSLLHRADRGETDFSVFYRAGRLLNRGAGAELYAARDAATGWHRSIPPFGMIAFRGLALLEPGPASVVWAGVNLALLAGGVACLFGIARRLDARREELHRALPWAAALLVILSCGSIQTGQWSVLFVVCWLAYLRADAAGRPLLAGAALAVPISIKFYPVLMAAVPALRRKWTQLALAFAACAIFTVIVVLAVYGARGWDLSASYVGHMFFAEHNLVDFRFREQTLPNQSLDVAMLRYLTDAPRFHRGSPGVPHLSLPRSDVLAAAHAIRALIVLVAGVAAWRWLRRGPPPRFAAFMMTALWAATLYLILPETKGRYAVYTLPAFLPLLIAAGEAEIARRRARHVGLILLIVFCLVCVIGLPLLLERYTVGLLGPVVLWAVTMGSLLARRPAG